MSYDMMGILGESNFILIQCLYLTRRMSTIRKYIREWQFDIHDISIGNIFENMLSVIEQCEYIHLSNSYPNFCSLLCCWQLLWLKLKKVLIFKLVWMNKPDQRAVLSKNIQRFKFKSELFKGQILLWRKYEVWHHKKLSTSTRSRL